MPQFLKNPVDGSGFTDSPGHHPSQIPGNPEYPENPEYQENQKYPENPEYLENLENPENY